MRILTVVHGWPPAAVGGTELYARALTTALAQGGDQVLVIARECDERRDDHATRRVRDGGVDVLFVNNTFRHVRRFRDSYTDPAIDALVGEATDAFAPDVAHIHHLTCLSTTLVNELSRRRVPVVLSLHDYWMLCHRGQLFDLNLEPCAGPDGGCQACIGAEAGADALPGPLGGVALATVRSMPLAVRRAIDRLSSRAVATPAAAATTERRRHMREVLEAVDAFIAPSRAMRDRFVQIGIDPSRVLVNPCGIALPTATTREATTPGAPLRIGYVGSLMVSKAPDVLLRAFDRLPRGIATLDLYGAFTPYHGDVSYKDVLSPWLQVPGVTAHGAWPHSRINEAFAGMDVLVVPSRWPETAGLVVRESMAMGVPVVAASVGGIPEAIREGIDGLLVAPGDVDGLASTLRLLAEDRTALARLRPDPALVPTLDADVMVVRTLYHRLVAVQSARPS